MSAWDTVSGSGWDDSTAWDDTFTAPPAPGEEPPPPATGQTWDTPTLWGATDVGWAGQPAVPIVPEDPAVPPTPDPVDPPPPLYPTILDPSSLFTYVALGEDGYEPLQLWPSRGVAWVQELDLGFPETRTSSRNRTLASGSVDRTRYHGAKAVSISLVLFGKAAVVNDLEDALRGWAAPFRRPRLTYQRRGQERRYVDLVGDQLSSQLTVSNRSHVLAQLSWRCPEGRSFTVDETVVTSTPSTPETPGRGYPLAFSRTYPTGGRRGRSNALNRGTAPTWPVLRIYGPCTDPNVLNQRTGRRIAFSDTIPSGSFVEVSMRDRTVQLNGVPGPDMSRRSRLTVRQWWDLHPGDNVLLFTAADSTDPCQVTITYQASWL